ncbi:MAG: transcription-repair coupling factor [Melioribacteraceae bacterium]|nr:transcription-repair coupling factor [Melioribacteraceae bacterium]
MAADLHKVFSKFEKISSLQLRITNTFPENNRQYITALPGSSLPLVIQILKNSFRQLVVIADNQQRVNELMVEFSILGLAEFIITVDDFSFDVLQEKLTDISSREGFIILTTGSILLHNLPSRDKIKENTTTLEIGGSLTYEDIIDYLTISNYSRDKFVESPGDFAVRGSIIDFWSYSEKQPCRLEFDGDFLESIRYFDAESQRSSFKVDKVTVASQVESEINSEFTSTIFDYLNNPLIVTSQSQLNDLFKDNAEPSQDIMIDIDEELKEEIFDGADNDKSEQITLKEPGATAGKNHEDLFNQNAFWLIQEEVRNSENKFDLGLHATPAINSNFQILAGVLLNYAKKNYTIFISAENELQVKRLEDLLSELDPSLGNLIDAKLINIIDLAIKKGFVSRDEKFVLFTDYEIFNKPYRTKISSKKKYKKSRARDLASLKHGDFVVHENFGISRYAGLETINIGMTQQESIKILYAEGDVVYVNLNYLALVKKFSSNEEITPKLTNLKNNEWKTTKKKVKSKIMDAARQLIELYAKRKAIKGFQFNEDTIWQKELEASFMYEDTVDQAKVSDEVKNDMQNENPMDRLVCGDVGFGKTEIAVRAAFKAVNDNKQVALLVPTTILAEQHYNTFKDRLAQFPVRVDALSRFATKKEQSEIIKRLESGETDIVIGTHRLLSNDVKFKDLGLLVIDEEHRFGVMHKEKLRSMRTDVDTLTLTATPIPRTLNMSLLGARDLSIIATPPPNRIPIYTKVETFDIVKIREWIIQEITRDGQVYFVHDRVQSIDKIAAYLQRYIPELKIAVAHGQMKPSQLEKVIHDFLAKKSHVLIATKIIESGLDIPNVNTIIINRADRFGLAELHQLRGRVGRSDRQAYAYLLVPSLNTITKKAVRRLAAIEEYDDLGEGFNLSMRDLEIRGAGNLLGTEQSGAIDSVGFDLYVKMLDEAVEELKQSEFKNEFKDLPKAAERSSPIIDTYFEIGIPKNYMPDQADRLSFYTALFSIIKIEEIDEILDEMFDRYGKPPRMVDRLILAAKLRFSASLGLLERIVIKDDLIIIFLPKAEKEEFYKNAFPNLMQYIMRHHSRDIKFKQDKDLMKLEMKNKFETPEDSLNYLIEFCTRITNLTLESKEIL